MHIFVCPCIYKYIYINIYVYIDICMPYDHNIQKGATADLRVRLGIDSPGEGHEAFVFLELSPARPLQHVKASAALLACSLAGLLNYLLAALRCAVMWLPVVVLCWLACLPAVYNGACMPGIPSHLIPHTS